MGEYYYTALNGVQWILKDDDVARELAALRGEVERLERVSERLDKKLAEEYVKTMELQAALSRYREAVEWMCQSRMLEHCDTPPTDKEWGYFTDEFKRRAGEG